MATQPPPARAAGTITIGDLSVTRLGYGTMQLPGPGVWGPPRDHDEAIAVLRRAVELGVNFIDTADSYGPHIAEELPSARATASTDGASDADPVRHSRGGLESSATMACG